MDFSLKLSFINFLWVYKPFCFTCPHFISKLLWLSQIMKCRVFFFFSFYQILCEVFPYCSNKTCRMTLSIIPLGEQGTSTWPIWLLFCGCDEVRKSTWGHLREQYCQCKGITIKNYGVFSDFTKHLTVKDLEIERVRVYSRGC